MILINYFVNFLTVVLEGQFWHVTYNYESIKTVLAIMHYKSYVIRCTSYALDLSRIRS